VSVNLRLDIRIHGQDNATKSMEKVSDSSKVLARDTQNLNKQLNAASQEAAQLRHEYGRLASGEQAQLIRALNHSALASAKSAEEIRGATRAISEYSSAVERANKQTISVVKTFALVGKAFAGLTSAISGTIRTLNQAVQLFGQLTDPKLIDRMKKITYVLGNVARFKGQAELGNMLLQASHGIDQYSKFLERAGISSGNFDEALDRLYNRIKLVNSIMETMPTVAKGAASAIGAYILLDARIDRPIVAFAQSAKMLAANSRESFSDVARNTKLLTEGLRENNFPLQLRKAIVDDIRAPINQSQQLIVKFSRDISREVTDVGNSIASGFRRFFHAGEQSSRFSSHINLNTASLSDLKNTSKLTAEQMAKFGSAARSPITALSTFVKGVKVLNVDVLDAKNNIISTATAISRPVKSGFFDPFLTGFARFRAATDPAVIRQASQNIFSLLGAQDNRQISMIVDIYAKAIRPIAMLTHGFKNFSQATRETIPGIEAAGRAIGIIPAAINAMAGSIKTANGVVKSIFSSVRATVSGASAIMTESFSRISESFYRFRTIVSLTMKDSNSAVIIFLEQIRQRFSNAAVIFRNLEDPIRGFTGVFDRLASANVAFRSAFKFDDVANDFKKMFLTINANARLALNTTTQSFLTSGSALTGAAQKMFSGATKSVGDFAKSMQTVQLISRTMLDDKVFLSLHGIQGSFSALNTSIKAFALESSQTFSQMGTSIAQSSKRALDGTIGLARGVGIASRETLGFGRAISAAHVGPSFLMMAEHSIILSTALFALGQVMFATSEKTGKFVGALLIAASVLFGGFAIAVRYALNTLGNLSLAISDFLLDKMRIFEEKFRKAQVATEMFTFTLSGFRRELGEVVGTTSEWNQAIEDLFNTTLFARDDIQKSAAEIIAVGNAIGLTKDQQLAMLRLIPQHLKAGDNMFDATVAFVRALDGFGQGVIKYGLHVGESAIEHSKLVEELEITARVMGDAEKAQARFAAIIEQSAPKLGLAEAQTRTIAGANIILEKTIEDLMIKMGESSIITVLYYTALTKLFRSIAKLPDGLVSAVGTLQDFLGVSLKVLGVILKMALPIVSLVFLYNLLNIAVTKSIVVQTILTKTFAIMNMAVGAQSVAVISLTTLWANFNALLVGVVAKSLIAIKSILIGAAGAVWAMTKAVVANPLFWKWALIAGGIIAIAQGIRELERRTQFFSEALRSLTSFLQGATNEGGNFARFIEWLSDLLKGVFRAAIEAVVAMLGTFINAFLGAYYVVLYATKGIISALNAISISGGIDTSGLDAEIASTESRIARMAGVVEDASAGFLGMRNNMAMAAESAKRDFAGAINQARDALRGLKNELVSATRKELIEAEVLGLGNQALMLRKRLTEERILSEKEKDQRKQLAEDLIRIDAEIQKATIDSVSESDKALRDLYLRELQRTESIENIQKAAQVRLESDMEPLREMLQNLSFLPPTEEVSKAMELVRTVIIAKERDIIAETKKQIDEFTKKQQEQRQKEQEEQARALREAIDARIAFGLQIAKMMGDDTAQQQLQYQQQLVSFRRMLDDGLISASEYGAAIKALNSEISRVTSEKSKEAANRQREAYVGAMRAAGNTFEVIRIETENLIEQQANAYKEGLISFEEFEKAKTAIAKQQHKQRAQTTGSESLDVSLQSAQSFVTSIQSGISSIVSNIGAMFGPIGSLVAGIVNFFNMAAEEFDAMIDGLIQAILDLPANLARNIPIFVYKVMEALPQLIATFLEWFYSGLTSTILNAMAVAIAKLPELMSQALSPSFWLGIAKNAFNALVKAFKNLWAAIFGGKVIVDAMQPAIAAAKTAFGAGSEAGGGEFKVRDLALAEGRAVQTFEDRVESAVDIVGPGLLGYIAQGVEEIIKGILSAFSQVFNLVSMAAEAIGSALASAVGWAVDNVLAPMVQGIMDGFSWLDANVINPMMAGLKDVVDWTMTDLIGGIAEGIGSGLSWVSSEIFMPFLNGVGSVFAWVGTEILEPFAGAVVSALKWALEEVILKIPEYIGKGLELVFDFLFNRLPDLIGDAVGAAGDFFAEAGAFIWSGVVTAANAAWGFVKGIGKWIWDGLSEAIVAVGDFFARLGTSIWNGLKAGIDAAANLFARLGTSIWNGLKAGIDAAANLFASLGTGIWNGLKAAVGTVGNLFSNLGTGIWNALKSGLGSVGDFFANTGSVVWESIKKALGSAGNFLGQLFEFKGGGRGAVEKFLRFDFPWVAFAEGGRVPGRARVGGDSPVNDIVPALLSPGELVIPRSVVAGGDKSIVDFVRSVGRDTGIDRKAGEVVSTMESLGVEPIKRNWFKSGWDWITNVGGSVWDTVSGAAKGVYDFAAKVGGAVWDEVKNLPASIINALGGLGSEVLNIVKFLMEYGANIDWTKLIINPVGAVGDALKGMTGFLTERIFKPLLSGNFAGKSAGESIGTTIQTAVPPIIAANPGFNMGLGAIDIGKINIGTIPNLGFGGMPIGNIDLGFSSMIRLARGGEVKRMRGNRETVNAFRAAGVQQFANGGIVRGPSGVDNVPALLTPGEYVMPVREVREARRQETRNDEPRVSIVFNVHPGASLTEQQLRREVVPVVVEELRRQSRNGKNVLSPRGVFD